MVYIIKKYAPDVEAALTVYDSDIATCINKVRFDLLTFLKFALSIYN